MTLNKEDFTEEQWAEIQAEIDRGRTQASSTARKKAEQELERKLQERIEAAVAEEREKLEMDEQQKLEVERKKIEKAQSELARERKSLKATKKLAAAGVADEAIEKLLPMFTALDESAFDTTIDSFIEVNTNLVNTQVDAVKQELLQATPPGNNNAAPVDTEAQVKTALEQGNSVGAIDLLLQAAQS